MKAAILHRKGRIREKRAKETIGFNACVRRSLSDGNVKYLTKEQALVLQTINNLRDAAQHQLLDISDDQLYLHVQLGVTLPGLAKKRVRSGPRLLFAVTFVSGFHLGTHGSRHSL